MPHGTLAVGPVLCARLPPAEGRPLMELWIPITVCAAFLQNMRSAAQKHLKGVMGTTGATFARFGFGCPVAVAIVVLLHVGRGDALPTPSTPFMLWMITGGITQIVATFLLVHLFSLRNFAVGTAYSRTEPAQAALFGLIFLGETVTAGLMIAIAISVAGVMMISLARVPLTWRAIVEALASRPAAIGLASGGFFAVSAVAYRAASTSLGGPNFVMQAAFTLAWTTLFQTVLMACWMLMRDRAELVRVAKAWRWSLVAGLAGGLASFGWFMAMTIQQAALVRSLAQVEMLFTFATTVFIFKERINRMEIGGCLLIVGGIVVLLMQR
jgi:drug/metabolite transporter (DMT)-like permease